jgi:hypothetical protein
MRCSSCNRCRCRDYMPFLLSRIRITCTKQSAAANPSIVSMVVSPLTCAHSASASKRVAKTKPRAEAMRQR